jgi:rSAM/selenodomain-associated transferase 2
MISIIIPTYNEEDNIAKLLLYLQECTQNKVVEIIVTDHASIDKTTAIATSLGVKVVISKKKGRAAQMNSGAFEATYNILYFVHADSFPPKTFYEDILAAVNNGYAIGRYRTKFEGNKWLLKLNAFFTRFDWLMCYGGDQTLFITKYLFEKIKGYDEKYVLMEEYDLVKRAKEFSKYKIFSDTTIVSIRKYETNSWLQVQRANYKAVQLFKKGVSQEELVSMYKKSLSGLK